MGDIAEILGMKAVVSATDAEVAKNILLGPKAGVKKMKKPKGMSREVFDLIGHDSLNPAMQTNKVVIQTGFKEKRASALKGRWMWSSFTNTSRSDDQV